MAGVKDLVTDPEFQRLSPEDQRRAVTALDPEFGVLSSEDFTRAVKALGGTGYAHPKVELPPSKEPGPQYYGATNTAMNLASRWPWEDKDDIAQVANDSRSGDDRALAMSNLYRRNTGRVGSLALPITAAAAPVPTLAGLAGGTGAGVLAGLLSPGGPGATNLTQDVVSTLAGSGIMGKFPNPSGSNIISTIRHPLKTLRGIGIGPNNPTVWDSIKPSPKEAVPPGPPPPPFPPKGPREPLWKDFGISPQETPDLSPIKPASGATPGGRVPGSPMKELLKQAPPQRVPQYKQEALIKKLLGLPEE